MKRRLVRILLAVTIGLALLAGTLFALVALLAEGEVHYQGRSRYYWRERMSSSDPAARNEAILVLNNKIIPGLSKTLLEDTNDSRLRIILVEKLNSLPGVNIFFRTADSRRSDAAGGLGEFGPPAAAAIPVLLQVLQGHDQVVRGSAAVSLGHIQANPDVLIPLLIGYLDDEDLREAAAEALGEYGSRAKGAVPKLLLLFKIPDKDLHHAVAEALKKIEPHAAAQAGVRLNDPAPQ